MGRTDTGRTGRRVLAGTALAAVLLLSGCGAEGGGRSSSDAAAPARAAAPKAEPTAGGGAAGAGAADRPAGQPTAAGTGNPSGTPAQNAADHRYIAYSGRLVLQLKADDKGGTAEAVRRTATDTGGYVGSESLSDSGGAEAGRLVLRVPSARYQQAMDRLAGLGTVASRSSDADDLTEQVVDTESRLKTQQASVDRVRALLADAKSLSEVVSLESELTRREADLESLKQRLQELGSQTSLSTITVELRRAADVPVAEEKPERGLWSAVGHAFAGGWHALLLLVRGLLVALAALAPFLAVLAPAAWLLRRGLKRRAASRPARPAPPVPVWGVPQQAGAPVRAPAQPQAAAAEPKPPSDPEPSAGPQQADGG
ncbi:DUF4349 domain-containing protein [Kitasatospora sp. NPDC085895]|uniref:DUF4349 domain-containing protein n=1 Tax=Kitasatospora sp. NPDC085895 TaxID=3155057 RepID=UPI00344C18FD